MLDIVICGSDLLDESFLRDILSGYKIEYNVHLFNELNCEFMGIINDGRNEKIYILDIKRRDRFVLKILSLIRSVDANSIIILISKAIKYHNRRLYNQYMILDFICYKDGNLMIEKQLDYAIKYIYKYRIFSFRYNHTIYRVPYVNINYIEKETSVKRCIIHTIDDNVYIVSSLGNLLNKLGIGFIKTHQSCIVNVNNVKMVDLNRNEIVFNNGMKTRLLSDKVKREFKEYVDKY